VGDTLVGLAQTAHGQAFWRDGICEIPPTGQVQSIAALGTGEIVAIVRTRAMNHEVLVRDAGGGWSTFGAVPVGTRPRLGFAAGRVVVYYQRNDAASNWEHGV